MRRDRFTVCSLLLVVLLGGAAHAALTAARIERNPDSWFTSDEGIVQIDNIISWQRPDGGWEKGYDATRPHPGGTPFIVPTTLPASSPTPRAEFFSWDVGTIDNNLTYTEIRVLAHAYNLTHRQSVLDSVNRGIDYLLTAQYPNGGWPQRFPLQNNYGRQITFNDNAMTGVMMLMSDIARGEKDFATIDADRRDKVKQSLERGLDCTLKCQIVSSGKLTAWAQQYDPQTLKPASARAYELPGIAAGESAAIAKFLMSLDDPSPQVQRAVHAAAKWFEESKITGKRLERRNGDVVLIDDANAEPVWARFYEIDTNRPFFCGRDGVKKYSLAEIERERRTGYAWYRPFGDAVLPAYANWSQKYPAK